nr:hypothetical protein [Tanacetum cinerariifolium]
AVGAKADFSNLETTITASPILTTRVHKDHHVTQIIGDLSSATQTRSMTRVVKDQGFKDPDYLDKVYKVVKALYGLHQAPKAWYEILANYLLEMVFRGERLTRPCSSRSKKLMKDKFQMSSMGKLTFVLGLQVKKKPDGIFISQDKYVAKILRKFDLTDEKLASTPIDTEKPLLKDPDGEDVDDLDSSQSPPHIDHHCCYGCGDSLDDIFCQLCTCKSCGNSAHHGYNCSPKVPIISNLEPCHDQNVKEFPQTLPSFHPTYYSRDENSFSYDLTPSLVNDSPNVFNPPSQPLMYSYEFCEDYAHYSYDYPPQVSFIYDLEPCYNQEFNFPQNFQSFQQQDPCYENCGGPDETFQCQQVIFYDPFYKNS